MKKEKKTAGKLSINSTEQTASGRLKPLLSCHKIVFRALRAANMALGRVVSANEIIELLTLSERNKLTSNYTTAFDASTRKIVSLLVRRGIVFKARKGGSEWYYGAQDIIDPETTHVPLKLSMRSLALKSAKEAVADQKRALRVDEIWTYAVQNQELCDSQRVDFGRAVMSLRQTGELKKVGVVRGDVKGSILYLPSELDESLYLPTEPLSWLEEASRAFDLVWQRHLNDAESEKRKPFAVSTGEVRAEWMKLPQACSKAFEPQPVVDAMARLATGTRHQPPKLRKIKRHNERFLLWCPADFTDEMLDSSTIYLSDFERIETAVKRAIAGLERPVTLSDVKDEIDLDPSLHLTGKTEIRKVLFDASKSNVGPDGSRRYKFSQRIYRVGMLDNVTYFHHGDKGLSKAYGYIETLILKSDWEKADIEIRLEQLKTLSVPEIAFGNAKLLLAECEDFITRVESLLRRRRIPKSNRNELINMISKSEQKASHAITALGNNLPQLPNDVNRQILGITGKDLVKILLPLYPKLKADTPSEKISIRFWTVIRRFRNPNFTNRFTLDAKKAAQFLFDRSDTLMYAGSKWGGLECAFQARIARTELGRLRDARFVIPALKSPDLRNRMIAICCLAFLSEEAGSDELLKLIRHDEEAGVRQSALWAYCFRYQNLADEIVNEVIKNDSNIVVRQFALKCLSLGSKGWWGI